MDGEEQETNPGRFGKALAHWLADGLRGRGVLVDRVFAEDFGWVAMVSGKPYPLWLGCGNIEGSKMEWTIFPVAEPSLLQRLFKRVDHSKEIDALHKHLVEIVRTVPRVSNVVWD